MADKIRTITVDSNTFLKRYGCKSRSSCNDIDFGVWSGAQPNTRLGKWEKVAPGLIQVYGPGSNAMQGSYDIIWNSSKSSKGLSAILRVNVNVPPISGGCIGENFQVTDVHDLGAYCAFTFVRTYDASLNYDDIASLAGFYTPESPVLTIGTDGQFGQASFKLIVEPEAHHGLSAVTYKVSIVQLSGNSNYMANIQGMSWYETGPVSVSIGGTSSNAGGGSIVIRNVQYSLPYRISFSISSRMSNMSVGYQLHFGVSNSGTWGC